MSEARRRISHYQIEIRRSARERILSKLRKDAIDAEDIEQAIETFVLQRGSEVPISLAERVSIMSKEALQKFLAILEASHITFEKSAQADKSLWYFDCTSKTNLKFMGGICRLQEVFERWSFPKRFAKATIDAHKVYNNLTCAFKLLVKDSQCFIQPQQLAFQGQSEDTTLISILNKNYDEQKFLAILQYWAIYIQQEYNPISNEIIIMVKTFLFWFEHTEIHEKEQTYDFIYQIFTFIKQSDILQKGSPLKELYNQLQIFATKITNFLPFAFAKLKFRQLGNILLRIIESAVQGLLSTLLFRSQTIVTYLKTIFSRDADSESISTISMGMHIVDSLANSNCLLQFHEKSERVAIFKKIASEYILHPYLQGISILMLRQLLATDLQKEIKAIFQLVNYPKLMTFLHMSNQQNALYFMVQSLKYLRQNKIIYDKILKDTELMKRFKTYCLEYEEPTDLTQVLSLAIDSNITFFVDNYMSDVMAMREIAKEMPFEGSSVFLSETEKYIDLKIKEDSL